MKHLMTLLKEEDDQALTEYGVLVGLIALGVIATLTLIGPELVKIFNDIKNGLIDANR